MTTLFTFSLMSSSPNTVTTGDAVAIAIIVGAVVATIITVVIVYRRRARVDSNSAVADSQCLKFDIHKFLKYMEEEKPIRFTSKQLKVATNNYSSKLGSGGFGEVYKGFLRNGTIVAVKVLHRSSDKRIEEQFMAEVSTIGRIHHFNLVRLLGFCFEQHTTALVYEYMGNGSLDKYLFDENNTLRFEKLHEIAVGTARGIAYLHEECQEIIIHYDIKPGNILLDNKFCPKVSDFGLAKLFNREKSHITLTCGRGTPGYAAPELWLPFPVTHKCDVYSFGMLLFEIVGRRRNHDSNLQESEEWFPMWVWNRFDLGQLGDMLLVCGIEKKNKEVAERMVKVALCCVQWKPESRPMMSVVVKMLEGSMEIPKPLNPFERLMDRIHPTHSVLETQTNSTLESGSTAVVTGSSILCATPVMRKYEIEIASS